MGLLTYKSVGYIRMKKGIGWQNNNSPIAVISQWNFEMPWCMYMYLVVGVWMRAYRYDMICDGSVCLSVNVECECVNVSVWMCVCKCRMRVCECVYMKVSSHLYRSWFMWPLYRNWICVHIPKLTGVFNLHNDNSVFLISWGNFPFTSLSHS